MPIIVGNNNYALPIEFGVIKEPIFLEIGKSLVSNHSAIFDTEIIECNNETDVLKEIRDNSPGKEIDIKELPLEGEEVEEKKFYKYKNEIVFSRVKHIRDKEEPNNRGGFIYFK